MAAIRKAFQAHPELHSFMSNDDHATRLYCDSLKQGNDLWKAGSKWAAVFHKDDDDNDDESVRQCLVEPLQTLDRLDLENTSFVVETLQFTNTGIVDPRSKVKPESALLQNLRKHLLPNTKAQVTLTKEMKKSEQKAASAVKDQEKAKAKFDKESAATATPQQEKKKQKAEKDLENATANAEKETKNNEELKAKNIKLIAELRKDTVRNLRGGLLSVLEARKKILEKERETVEEMLRVVEEIPAPEADPSIALPASSSPSSDSNTPSSLAPLKEKEEKDEPQEAFNARYTLLVVPGPQPSLQRSPSSTTNPPPPPKKSTRSATLPLTPEEIEKTPAPLPPTPPLPEKKEEEEEKKEEEKKAEKEEEEEEEEEDDANSFDEDEEKEEKEKKKDDAPQDN